MAGQFNLYELIQPQYSEIGEYRLFYCMCFKFISYDTENKCNFERFSISILESNFMKSSLKYPFKLLIIFGRLLTFIHFQCKIHFFNEVKSFCETIYVAHFLLMNKLNGDQTSSIILHAIFRMNFWKN